VGCHAVALLAQTPIATNDDPPKTARYYRQQAAAAYKAKDTTAAIENFKGRADNTGSSGLALQRVHLAHSPEERMSCRILPKSPIWVW
jgi:hypothetical protein